MLVVVEAFLLGQTLGFAAIRAIFVRRFGFVRPCPFQKRFKQASAAAFFRGALERLVVSVISNAGLSLSGSLAQFADVRVYDGTGQRVPPRGRKALPACTKGKAGSKWVVGYSIKTGLLGHAEGAAETASETPLWHKLVPSLATGVLYLFDLGFFERKLFCRGPSWVTGGKRSAARSGPLERDNGLRMRHHCAMAAPQPSRPTAAPAEHAMARRVRPADDDLAHVQAGLAEAAAGKGVAVTPDELAEWERTGELPASVEARLAACG